VRALAEAILLRVFVQEEDRYGRHALYKAIVARALEEKMAGATVLVGPLGFGRLRLVRSEFNVDAAQGLPMVVELVDNAEQIDRFLSALHGMIDSGLVTLKKVRALRYRRQDVSREAGASPPTLSSSSSMLRSARTRRSQMWAIQRGVREGAMDVPHDAVLLRIFTSVADRFGLEPLYRAIVLRAREMHLAGATVLRGPMGFGQSATLHQRHLFSDTDAPVVVEIVDSEEKINSFLPILDDMMESGLVIFEAAKVLQYSRPRAGLLQRIKQHFGRHSRAA
jgi:uncharacterized protein